MHFKAAEPARQPTFATEKTDRGREDGWTAGDLKTVEKEIATQVECVNDTRAR